MTWPAPWTTPRTPSNVATTPRAERRPTSPARPDERGAMPSPSHIRSARRCGHAGRVAGMGTTTRDPLGAAVAAALSDVLSNASVELTYAPAGEPASEPSPSVGTATATGAGPP